jgi:hypothetical protein
VAELETNLWAGQAKKKRKFFWYEAHHFPRNLVIDRILLFPLVTISGDAYINTIFLYNKKKLHHWSNLLLFSRQNQSFFEWPFPLMLAVVICKIEEQIPNSVKNSQQML